MTAPDFTVTLSPAQWEHLAEHGWTLTTAPTTECRNSLHDVRSAPVSEYHCPECGRAPYRSKDGDWYCFDPKGESTCRWRGPNPLVTPCCSPVPATVPCPECPTCGGVGRVGCPGPTKGRASERTGRMFIDWCYGIHMGHPCPDCHPQEATDDA